MQRANLNAEDHPVLLATHVKRDCDLISLVLVSFRPRHLVDSNLNLLQSPYCTVRNHRFRFPSSGREIDGHPVRMQSSLTSSSSPSLISFTGFDVPAAWLPFWLLLPQTWVRGTSTNSTQETIPRKDRPLRKPPGYSISTYH